MRAYLVYEPEEAEKNGKFIQMFQEEGKPHGISFDYVSASKYRQRELPDLVLNRTRLAEVSRYYEQKKCAVLHDSTIVEIGNDKWKTLVYLLGKSHEQGRVGYFGGKWLPDTLCLSAGRNGYPCILWRDGKEQMVYQDMDAFIRQHTALVIKTLSGHGGEQVEEVHSEEEINNFRKRFPGAGVIIQEKIECSNRDVRIYILGGQIYQGITRQGRGDFRSNFSRGGLAGIFSPTDKEAAQIEQILQCFEGHTLGMAGIDFLIGDDGRLYFNELEEMVGCRMLYHATDKNIVRDYVEWMRDNFL